HQLLHVVSHRPGEAGCRDHGPIAVGNPQFTEFKDASGKELPWHHGYFAPAEGVLAPRYTIMGICAARDGSVYVTTLAPFTLHALQIKR
ncbi:MAG: hypothetical protein ACKOFW_14985, partial [Planctomycetaceae bacterium]